MYAPRLKKGDTIGVICPSHVAEPARYERNFFVLNKLGFNVKIGENFYKDTDGYTASAQERADDLNTLVADDEVKMILFSGGDGASEILPLIDYENIRRHPKLFSSYSDATSILLAIHSQTGLITYYGLGVNNFNDLRYYDYTQFETHFLEGREAKDFDKDSVWRTLHGGACEGTLMGGYSSLFALTMGGRYFKFENKKFILLIEDHEKYSTPNTFNSYLSFIEQSPIMTNVVGALIGHYAVEVPDVLLNRLTRFGEKNGIPVVYTDDFGHGTKHAILPIGAKVKLDADAQSLTFLGE
jgi:muramoyltetrapeptide carboxypeptidase